MIKHQEIKKNLAGHNDKEKFQDKSSISIVRKESDLEVIGSEEK